MSNVDVKAPARDWFKLALRRMHGIQQAGTLRARPCSDLVAGTGFIQRTIGGSVHVESFGSGRAHAEGIRWYTKGFAEKPSVAARRRFDVFVYNDLAAYVGRDKQKMLYNYDATRSYGDIVLGGAESFCLSAKRPWSTRSPRPWELGSSEIELVRTFEGEIIRPEGNDYLIEFADYDGGMVEARLDKREFEGFPYPVEPETWFEIVMYRRRDRQGITASAWPLMQYWHPSLQETLDDE